MQELWSLEMEIRVQILEAACLFKHYVHPWTNTFWKGMNSFILTSDEFDRTTVFLLQGWFWLKITHENRYAIK